MVASRQVMVIDRLKALEICARLSGVEVSPINGLLVAG